MSTCTAGCGTETDLYLCDQCAESFAEDLRSASWLAGELDVTISRQTGAAIGSMRPSAEKPLPVNMRAADIAARLQSELMHWSAEVAGMRGTDVDAVSTAGFAVWLLANVDGVRLHPHAGEIARNIADVVRDAVHVIDRPAERWYAGPCECGADMYSRSKEGSVRCPQCQAEYDVTERRESLLSEIEDQWATTEELSSALGSLGKPVTPARIRQWSSRGKLVKLPPHPADKNQRPRYRVAEVLSLLTNSAA